MREHLTCSLALRLGDFGSLRATSDERYALSYTLIRSEPSLPVRTPSGTHSAVTAEMPGPLLKFRKLATIITVGVLQLPTPMVRIHLLRRPGRSPTQYLARRGRVCKADGDVTGPALPDFLGDRAPARCLECANDVQNAAAVARAKIDREHAGPSEVAQGTQMPGCEIDYMNEVADSGAIGHFIVVFPICSNLRHKR
ncbi:hypothetical protein FBZ94_1011058 [Bradyrhizobium sacchari]|uniref:Uncharacterized protein n=1 Tax=Bradyrhizobium sacchari TaxID=1399419 RepID=A0A560J8K3_9BRAD|nr:hypothetical protein FBZ94_1011058 [Bradyrhizobium sacchari]TWB84613.1 hypothetical protein FBZ95_1011058 [Bradyrhizobium sacchari]